MELFELLQYLRPFIHYSLHFIAPAFIAYGLWRTEWKKAWLVMLATMLVDADHLLAQPIFVADRCSIGFHYLHSYPAIFFYSVLLFIPKLRIVAVGLLFHMLTDQIDCWLMG